jgi:hypothetical protein
VVLVQAPKLRAAAGEWPRHLQRRQATTHHHTNTRARRRLSRSSTLQAGWRASPHCAPAAPQAHPRRKPATREQQPHPMAPWCCNPLLKTAAGRHQLCCCCCLLVVLLAA